MTEKPDKLIPRLFRFTDDDIQKLGEMRELYAEPSDAAALRLAIGIAYHTSFPERA